MPLYHLHLNSLEVADGDIIPFEEVNVAVGSMVTTVVVLLGGACIGTSRPYNWNATSFLLSS